MHINLPSGFRTGVLDILGVFMSSPCCLPCNQNVCFLFLFMSISIEIRSHVAYADFELITVKEGYLELLTLLGPPPKLWDHKNEGPGLWGDHPSVSLFQ